ncbi:MAG: UbiA family prenyltransferase, partial [Rubrivivax sp.]|nr:UbiA family prenyltransferase [Rubrivivax sp.]
GFGIPMSYAALWGEVPQEAWIMLLANVFWAIAYDTQYAMVDREDDLKIGIKTSAITFGRFDLAAIALCYAATLGLLGWVGMQREMGWAFYGGLAVAAAIALYHMVLIRQRDPGQCFRAFLHNTWFGAAVFGGIALHFLLR